MPVPNLQSLTPNPQSPTTAMILAAGEGTRLRPLTLEVPKVLLPIGGVPLICYTLAWLRRYGISQVVINLHYLGEKIRQFLGDGSRFGVEIIYSPEETLLGTAGGVKNMERLLASKSRSLAPNPQPSVPHSFVVVYGDNLTDLDLSTMVSFHRAKKALATLALFQATDPQEVGIVKLDKEDRVVSFVEKPKSPTPNPQPPATFANAGIYILQRECLDYIPGQGFIDFARDIFPRVIELGLPIYGYRLRSGDYLIDIGTPEKYRKANEDVLDHSKFKIQSATLTTEPRTLNTEP
jgi:mannose-1-phosphate guanylyltransferase